MKIIIVTAVVCAFGVFHASAASSDKCQSGNIIENTLNGFLGTVNNSLTTVETNRDQLTTIANNITDQGNALVTKTFNTFLGNILNTVSDLSGVPVDDLQANCTSANNDQSALREEALALLTNCSNNALSSAQANLDTVTSTANSLESSINSAISKAQTSCTTPSEVVECVSSVLGDIPHETAELSKQIMNTGLDVAGLDVASIVSSCSSDAVGSVLGNACNTLSDLQTCAKTLANNK